MAEPIENSFQNMCTMVGLMTLTWAYGENALAISIGIIDQNNPSVLDGHTEFPVSLKKKLEYVRKALSQIDALEPLKQDGATLVQLFGTLAKRRNEIVHGSAWYMSEGQFERFNLQTKRRNYAVAQKSVEIADILKFNVEIDALNVSAMAFLLRVSEIYP